MSEAPADMWVRPWAGGWYETQFREEPAAVRYVRADLYEALRERLRQEARCLEPWDVEYQAAERNPR